MTLIVCPLSHVERVLRTRKPSHVITLLAPEGPHPSCGDARHLVLRFNDITMAAEGLVAPCPEIVREILDFGAAWSATTPRAPILVHCFAGISRSTAAAYILACAFAGPGRERALAANLRQASPTATPNNLMIALGDEMLGRAGRMTTAIQAIDRGAFAAEGVPFDLIFD
ncbi:MAG: tyrosine phosphatase family protein [Rhodospirillaceae bacterium]